MPPGSKKSPPALTDVQRLFGEDRLPDEVDVDREGAVSPAIDETAEMRAALERHRAASDIRDTAQARMLAEAPPEVLAELAKAEGVTPGWMVVEGDPRDHMEDDEGDRLIDGKRIVERLPYALAEWWKPLVRPPRDDLVGAYACLLVASIIGASREDGLVTNDDLFALLPRATVNDALQRLRYSGLLRVLPDGRFSVIKTPLDLLKEKAA